MKLVNSRKRKTKKERNTLSTKDLMGISSITDYSIATKYGNIVFFIIKPTNISVLPDASVSARIHSLLDVVKGNADIEMLALNSTESFDSNKTYYQSRIENEELLSIRKLLEKDCEHLNRIQAMMASAREFYIMVRLRNEKESEILPYLSRIEKNIGDNGFITKRAGEQDIKRMLGVYFEQNVTTEHYDSVDGERWIVFGD